MGSLFRNKVRGSTETRKAIKSFRKLKKRQKAPCVVCGRDWKWYARFHAHHLFPVKLFPEQAANSETFRWVHAKCHLVVGHGGSWKNYQSQFDSLADLTRAGLNPHQD